MKFKSLLQTYPYLIVPVLFLLSTILMDILTFALMGFSFPSRYIFSMIVLLIICAMLILIKSKWTQFGVAVFFLFIHFAMSCANIIGYLSLSEILSIETLSFSVAQQYSALSSLQPSYYWYILAPLPIFLAFLGVSIAALKSINSTPLYTLPPYRRNLYTSVAILATTCYIAGFCFAFTLPQLSTDASDAYTNNSNIRYHYETFTGRMEVLKEFGTYSYYWSNLCFLLGLRNSSFVYNVPSNEVSTFTFNSLDGRENVIMMMMEGIEQRAINPITMPRLSAFIKNCVGVDGYHSMNRTYCTEYASLAGMGLNQVEMCNYPETVAPYSLPYILNNSPRRQYDSVRGFHDYYSEFYNRNTMFPNGLGFQEYIAIEDMPSLNPSTTLIGRRQFNEYSDYYMMVDLLGYNQENNTFNPNNKFAPAGNSKFFTYLTNITTHSPYYDLDLSSLYPESAAIVDNPDNIVKLAKLYTHFDYTITDGQLEFTSPYDAKALRNFLITCYEYDRAIGLLLDYLEKYNLLDTTTIVFYADHYMYMNPDLLNSPENPTYHDPAGGKLPLYIHSPAFVGTDYENGGTIKKFTVNYDIYATMADLLHIKINTKYTLGISIFSSERNIGLNVKTSQIFTDTYLAPFDLTSFEPGSIVPDAEEIERAKERLSYMLSVMHNMRVCYMRNTVQDFDDAYYL